MKELKIIKRYQNRKLYDTHESSYVTLDEIAKMIKGGEDLRVIDNKLTLHQFQRSADVPVGVPSNMVQYGALLMMIAQATGTIPHEYVHSFSDAHIFVDQVPAVETMLSREPKALATMKIDTSVTNFFDFRKDHFTLEDYTPHPGIKGIPVAI